MAPLSPERWRVLSPYLDQALELAGNERAQWLASVARQDATLAADLDRLLAEHAALHQAHFLEHELPALGRPPMTPSLEGQVLGAYRLVSRLGQGGMGSVWLAERCDGRFEGRAAVKLLNISLVGRSGEERFRREGTILARLTHPNIARLIDAGVSATSQPYLVLEYVEGEYLDQYCDARRLGIEERLRLFLDVLEAVAHAHAHLIVHRDIKPANVLVSATGGVKLLDFGIAKLLESESRSTPGAAEQTALTRENALVLTPEYAAPEQVVHGEITTATDVYALGVLLYVLLTGQHPSASMSASATTLIRSIAQVAPRRMSDAVRTPDKEAIARHAAHCGATPAKLRRLLRGDLDTIVARALRKDPAERYASVTALAEDVRRYLRDEPVSSRAGGIRYRTGRFLRRHARSVASVAGVVALIAVLTGFYTTRLARERDRAQREAAKAVKVSEMLMGVLTSADPYTIRGTSKEPSLRGLLDAGAEQVQAELTDQPELQAEMLTMLGRTYRRLGVYDRAQDLLERALASGREAFGAEHVRIAQTLDYLGGVLADKGDYAAAGRTLEQALGLRRRLLGEHADVAVTLAELGRVYQDQGLNDRAEPLHREALAMRQKVLGHGHRETAVSLSDVASVLRLKGDLSPAEALLRQSLEVNRKTRGEEHPNTAMALHDLALIAAMRGDDGAAELQFRRVLEMQRRAFGDRHPVVATTLNNLSRVLARSGQYPEAVSALEQALDVVRAALGIQHQLAAIYSLNLASLHVRDKRPAMAEPLIRDALRVRALAPDIVPSRRRTLVEDDWSLGAAKSLLGASLLALARYEEAEAALLEARRSLAASPASQPGALTTAIARLVDLYVAWGKPETAAAYRAQLGSS